MTPRAGGRRRPCTPADARARLHDAEAFLEVAETAVHPDVKATNAIHAGIAAADAITCLARRERSADQDHRVAVDLLGAVDAHLAVTFSRLLARKQQAAYESRDLSARDAATCLRQAEALVAAARARALKG
ncbi:MAG TPA: hypothetical protein VFS16_08390 [Acidimicrobiia bacterium]|nr:hypothetical protein [Acidimicrobiia bacterium]